MKIPQRLYLAIAVCLPALPFNSVADSWSCRHNSNVREIHIQRETDAPVPCSIVYKKLTEGVGDQVLWRAENDPDFCQEKARAFVAKQEGWGWNCEEITKDEAAKETSTTSEADTSVAE
jgi:hypothetical protein